jgi:hypothetical protein
LPRPPPSRTVDLPAPDDDATVSADPDRPVHDPRPPADRAAAARLFRNARREAVTVAVVWLLALLWTVGYCARHAYGRAADDLGTVLGFPDWAFWGIFVPWALCTSFTVVYCLWGVADDDLGADQDEGAGA